MANLQLTGTLQAAPPNSEDSTFPAGSESTPLFLTPSPKPAPVDTGFQHRNVSSPSAYVGLSGVGASDTVTQGNFLYVRTKNPMLLRLTVNTSGPVVIADIPVRGIFMLEFDETHPLVLLEIKGAGTVEWYISGNL